MVLFIIVLGVICLIFLILFLLCISNLEIEIKKFKLNTNNLKGEKIEDYLICIKLKILEKLTWLKFTIDDEKINKIKKSKKMNNRLLELTSKLKGFIKNNKKNILEIKNVKYLNIELKKINLEMQLNILDNILTSFAVVIISTLLSIVISRGMKKYNEDECRYIIKPMYSENIQIIIDLNCIIDVKMVHIINIVYMLFKKRSVKYDERTSDRRAYVCRNE